MDTNFKPVNCLRCGAVVWRGISWAGFAKALDTRRLTIEEELFKVLAGLWTYEAHRTKVSFEVVERSSQRITWGDPKKDRVILADHICSGVRLFETLEDAPDYWNSNRLKYRTLEETLF